jgi:microcystin-dependent protein
MSDPFLGEVRPWALNFAPRGWLMCEGQLLPISQFTALFALIGTFYGGNGTSNFALPDLRSRVPMKYGTDPTGNNYVIGEQGGEEAVAITLATLPSHNHAFSGTTSSADIKRPVTGSAYAQSTTAQSVSPGDNFYAAGNSNVVPINPTTVQPYPGSGLAHENRQPFLAINWCIATAGIFPARN